MHLVANLRDFGVDEDQGYQSYVVSEITGNGVHTVCWAGDAEQDDPAFRFKYDKTGRLEVRAVQKALFAHKETVDDVRRSAELLGPNRLDFRPTSDVPTFVGLTNLGREPFDLGNCTSPKLYYEVTINVKHDVKHNNEDTVIVGWCDRPQDGWSSSRPVIFGYKLPGLKPGDVIGCLADFGTRDSVTEGSTITFAHNGKTLKGKMQHSIVNGTP